MFRAVYHEPLDGFLLIDVAQTFRAHEILLTGANGFLGKVLLGMLCDRFPDLKHVHVLVRPKWNLSAPERFERETLTSPALAGVVETLGSDFFRQKVTVLAGDVGEPNCGVDTASLAGRVGAMINCAGLVDFFPPVDQSFRSNVDGARNTAALAKQLGAKLVHVSTCFVCGEGDGLVEESQPIAGFYPRRKGPSDISFDHEVEIRSCHDRIQQIYGSSGVKSASRDSTRRLIELGRQRAEQWGWVNTYTYAKSLGEQIIAADPDLDSVIVRPAIIESSLRFPFAGWIEGGRTAAPLVLMARGGLKDWPVRRDAPLDVVPVDLVAAAILAVAALLIDGRCETVYQLGAADANPILLQDLVSLLADDPQFVSPEEARIRRLRLQKRITRAQGVLAGARRALDRTGLPGRESLIAWGMALRTRGLQASLREQTLDQYLPFILHNRYIFETENIRAAYAQLSPKDRQLLPWDPEQIDWREYWLNNQIKGIEKWIQPEAVKDWALKI